MFAEIYTRNTKKRNGKKDYRTSDFEARVSLRNSACKHHTNAPVRCKGGNVCRPIGSRIFSLDLTYH